MVVKVILHGVNGTHEQEIPENSNLVVLAGLKKFPGLRYSCGMGRCGKCASRVIRGAEHLPPPNWKEERVLGEDKLQEGYRLMCQLYLTHDIEIEQDKVPIVPAYRRVGQKA